MNPSFQSTSRSPAQDPAFQTKRSLSGDRQRLVELMQRLGFGLIKGLQVRDGNPVLDPLPEVTREHKFGGENGPRPELAATDFALKTQVIELFREFDRLRDTTIAVLEVKHGLPFRMLLADLP
jgi:hypothetical protein